MGKFSHTTGLVEYNLMLLYGYRFKPQWHITPWSGCYCNARKDAAAAWPLRAANEQPIILSSS